MQRASHMALVVKNPLANAGDIRGQDSICILEIFSIFKKNAIRILTTVALNLYYASSSMDILTY